MTEKDTAMVGGLLTALPSGPAEMTEAFPLLVQTSPNLSGTFSIYSREKYEKSNNVTY